MAIEEFTVISIVDASNNPIMFTDFVERIITRVVSIWTLFFNQSWSIAFVEHRAIVSVRQTNVLPGCLVFTFENSAVVTWRFLNFTSQQVVELERLIDVRKLSCCQHKNEGCKWKQ